MEKFATNASGAIWWTILQLMQVTQPGEKICNLCNWCHLVAKFATNAIGAIWGHLMDNFATNANCATWWPNLDSMQVAFYLAGEITQVIDSIPWVRCASGNVNRAVKANQVIKLSALQLGTFALEICVISKHQLDFGLNNVKV